MSKIGRPANTIESVLASVEILPNGCWRVPNKPGKAGYVRVQVAGAQVRLHVLLYRHLVGPIPEGLVLDHYCRHRWCGNPAHLEAVTDRVNILRGVGPCAINAQKTHCNQGHPLSGDNLTVIQGRRICRTCRRATYERYNRVRRGRK